MSNNQIWNNLGGEITDAVDNALRTGDFSRLSSVISETASGALDIAVDQIRQASANARQQKMQRGADDWQRYGHGGREERHFQNNPHAQGSPHYRNRPYDTQPAARGTGFALQAPFKRIGRVSSILYQVFGGVGTGLMSLMFLVFAGLALTYGGGFRFAFGIFGVLLVGFIVMINVGFRQKLRLGRAEKYRELSGNKHYINVEDLALQTGKTKEYIRKDLRKMIRDGFFPQGHLDTQENCLMLDDKIYSEYLDLEKQRRAQEKEKEKSGEISETDASRQTEEDKLGAMIAEGQDYIRRLRNMNDNIPGEVISAKLYRLENLLKEIFDRLKDHPEQMPHMQKFMNYYLPTTVKIVGAYEEFDSLSVQGEDILTAKAEIEKSIDTINDAFGELLNKLFRDAAYDATTDAQVLSTMLAKEGLAGGIKSAREKELIPR